MCGFLRKKLTNGWISSVTIEARLGTGAHLRLYFAGEVN